MKKFIDLANHIIAMEGDAYLNGHPEWYEIVTEAKKAILKNQNALKVEFIDNDTRLVNGERIIWNGHDWVNEN